MKKLFQNDHFKSFIHTFITDLLWDMTVGASVSHIFFEKDFSETALYALGYAVFRTLIRALREYFDKPKVLTPEALQDMNP